MSEELPPLANFVALRSRDPDRVARFESRALREGLELSRPVEGWTVALKRLPLSARVADGQEEGGLYFAEGADRLVRAGRTGEDVAVIDARLDDADPAALARLPGDFTFLRVREDGSCFVARSCGGLVPVYVWDSPATEDLVISTLATWLATVASFDEGPDLQNTALWFTGWPVFLAGQSHLQNVRAMAKGELFRASGAASEVCRYWHPPSASVLRWPTPGREARAQEEFRSLLLDGLRRNLSRAEPNLLTLSGGVDSSCLLALTAGHLGLPVQTHSIVPGPDAAHHARERALLEDLRQTFGVEQYSEVEFLSAEQRSALDALPLVLFPIFNPTLAGLALRPGAMPAVAFGGELADEVVGSLNFTLPDLALHLGWRWPLVAWRLPRSKALLRELLRRTVGSARGQQLSAMPSPTPEAWYPWLSRAWIRGLAELESDQAAALAPGQANPTLWSRTLHMDWQAMQWEMTSAVGVRRFNPFSTREVLDFALRQHPLVLVGPRAKRLMRGALAQAVPDRFLFAQDKPALGYAPLPEAEADVPRELAEEPWRQLVSEGPIGDTGELEYLILAARWPESYRELTSEPKDPYVY